MKLQAALATAYALSFGVIAAGYAAGPQETKQLLGKIHHANTTEIELGQVAQQKAQSEQVKDFAQQMISAHRDADQKVQKAAASQNIPLQKPEAAKTDKKREKLSQATGAEFDKEYIALMVEKHDDLLKELEKSQNWLPQGEVRTLSLELAATVRQHLEHARQIKQSL
jgi:putative membrane protein